MSKRFGRNQKRKLKERLEIEIHRADYFERESKKLKENMREVVDRVQRYSNLITSPPSDIEVSELEHKRQFILEESIYSWLCWSDSLIDVTETQMIKTCVLESIELVVEYLNHMGAYHCILRTPEGQSNYMINNDAIKKLGSSGSDYLIRKVSTQLVKLLYDKKGQAHDQGQKRQDHHSQADVL